MTTAVQSPYALDLALPWEIDETQEQKFKRTLRRLLIPLLLLFLVVPWLPTFDREYEEPEVDIVRTKVVLEPLVVTPEPTPVPVAPRPDPVPKPKPTPKPEPKQRKAEVPREVKSIAPAEKKRNIAEEQGLTQISSQLSSLRQSLDLNKLQKKNVSTSEGGKIARADRTKLGDDQINRRSEGIVVDETVMKSQNVALAAHESTRLDGFVDGGSPDGDLNAFYSDLRSQRSDESIRRVLEGGKSRAYSYYQRVLRDRPGLSGVLVFELVIEPSGTISDLKLVSSELNSPGLERQILDSVRRLNFGAQDVSPRRLQYKFNFLPS